MHCTHRPVVVEMAEFVSESLHVVGTQATGVTYNVEVSWSDSPLPHRLAHQKEIVPVCVRVCVCVCVCVHVRVNMHA